jgi:hypothetical protein
VHGNGGSGAWIPHLVKPLRVFNKYDATFVKGLILCTLERAGIVLRCPIPTLLDLALKNFHPASVAGMVVNRRFLTGIPAE